MSVEQVRAALDCAADIPAPARHVLLVLATYADADGKRAFPSVASLSRKTGLARRSIQRAFRALESAGLISVQERSVGSLPTCYRLTLPSVTQSPRQRVAPRPTGAGGAPDSTQRGATQSQRGAPLAPNPSVISHEPRNAGAHAREERAPAQAGNGTGNGTGNGHADPPRPRKTQAEALAALDAALPIAKPIPSEASRLLEVERRRREAAALAESLAPHPPK